MAGYPPSTRPRSRWWYENQMDRNNGYHTLKAALPDCGSLGDVGSALWPHADEFPSRSRLGEAARHIAGELPSYHWRQERTLMTALADAVETRYLGESAIDFCFSLVAAECIRESVFWATDYKTLKRNLRSDLHLLQRSKSGAELCSEALAYTASGTRKAQLLQEMFEHLTLPGNSFETFFNGPSQSQPSDHTPADRVQSQAPPSHTSVQLVPETASWALQHAAGRVQGSVAPLTVAAPVGNEVHEDHGWDSDSTKVEDDQ